LAEPTITRPKKYTDGDYSCFRVRVVFPFDEQLGYRPKEKAFRAQTARDALNNAKDWVRRRAWENAPHDVERRTFGAYLKDEYLPDLEAAVKANNKSWAAFRDRKSRLTRYVLEPTADLKAVVACDLRKVVLRHLRPSHMERYRKALERDAVSAHLRDDLRGDLSLAVKAAKRSLPERPRDYFEDWPNVKIEGTERTIFDYDDVRSRYMDESKPLEARAYAALIFEQRRRPNEVDALRWTDIDFTQRIVTFDKAVRRTSHGYEVTAHTKSGRRGDRRNPMSAYLAELLRRFQKERMASGTPMSEFIFPNARGSFRTQHQSYDCWRSYRTELGLPPGPWRYSLKHAGITFAGANGQNASMQREFTGHRDTRMIERVYTRIPDKAKVEAIALFDRPKQGRSPRAAQHGRFRGR